ncbi:MAG: Crp/Fnr family transcriptional regulator [candidate division Zixibacteria bacterium]|nr:Crp/Fnr family transcriptional regulator [candidate division Zixibacteria bacterium]
MKTAVPLVDKTELVRKIPFFASLSGADAKKIADLLVERTVKRGEYLFWEGDPADWLYVVKEGKIKLIKSGPNGKEMVLEMVPPGQVCGTAVIYSPTHLSSAVAESSTTAFGLRRSELEKFVYGTPQMAKAVIQYLGSRLKSAHDTITGLVTSKVETRIASVLVKLAEHHGSQTPKGVRINIPLTRKDIGDAVGATVETTIRTLSRFQKQKILATESKHIFILDLPRLTKLTE